MGKLLGTFGIVGTFAYAAWWTRWVWDHWDKMVAISPNDLGSFLGGSFGPLAFLWLVLGYFQQGIELRQNSEALRLQAEELKNSVEQQKQMVEVAKKEHEATIDALNFERQRSEEERKEADRAALPRFFFETGGWSLTGGRGSWDLFLVQRWRRCVGRSRGTAGWLKPSWVWTAPVSGPESR